MDNILKLNNDEQLHLRCFPNAAHPLILQWVDRQVRINSPWKQIQNKTNAKYVM